MSFTVQNNGCKDQSIQNYVIKLWKHNHWLGVRLEVDIIGTASYHTSHQSFQEWNTSTNLITLRCPMECQALYVSCSDHTPRGFLISCETQTQGALATQDGHIKNAKHILKKTLTLSSCCSYDNKSSTKHGMVTDTPATLPLSLREKRRHLAKFLCCQGKSCT